MSILLRAYRDNVIDSFIADFANTSSNVYYIALSGITAHSDPDDSSIDDNNPPTESSDLENFFYKTHRELILGKAVFPSDVRKMIRRYNWSSNTIYRQFDDQDKLMLSNNNGYYVITDDNNVYKCLFNGYGIPSTQKPTGTNPEPFYTTDDANTGIGYRWQFMYQIDTDTFNDFATTDFIPINTFEDGGTIYGDANVVSEAVNGSIESILLTTNGAGYSAYVNGTVVSTTSANVVLSFDDEKSGVTDENGSLVNNAIYITSGSGAGQIKTITAYQANNKTITTNNAFSNLDGTSVFTISPAVNITGDGSGALAYSTIDSSSNTINNIRIINRGSDYSFANVTIVTNTAFRTADAAARIVKSPPGGHGSDTAVELGSQHVQIFKQFSGPVDTTLPTDITFRKVALLKNLTHEGGDLFYNDSFVHLTKFGVSATGGSTPSIPAGHQISTATGNGTVAFANSTLIRVANTNGSFSNGQEILSANAQINRAYQINISSSSLIVGDVKRFSGEVLYYQNVTATDRDASQTENLRLIIKA